MLSASARFETPNAPKYLKQLCKHFAHKVSVEYDDTNGKAALPPGPATMQADDVALSVTVTAQDEEGLERAKFIIDDNLSRFVFRETPDLNWDEPATA